MRVNCGKNANGFLSGHKKTVEKKAHSRVSLISSNYDLQQDDRRTTNECSTNIYYIYRRMVLLLFRVVAEPKMIAIRTRWQWRGRQGSTHLLYVEWTMDFTVSINIGGRTKILKFLQVKLFCFFQCMWRWVSRTQTWSQSISTWRMRRALRSLTSWSHRYPALPVTGTKLTCVVFIYLDEPGNMRLLKYLALTVLTRRYL